MSAGVNNLLQSRPAGRWEFPSGGMKQSMITTIPLADDPEYVTVLCNPALIPS